MIAITEIIEDFIKAAALARIRISQADLEIRPHPAPHTPPCALPSEKLAVYFFMFGDRCLKVGKAGPKSAARYCSQHYLANGAPSTLAKSILDAQSNLGVGGLDAANIKTWICQHTDRVNLLLPVGHGMLTLSLLEVFIQCRLQPEFEGFASQRSCRTST